MAVLIIPSNSFNGDTTSLPPGLSPIKACIGPLVIPPVANFGILIPLFFSRILFFASFKTCVAVFPPPPLPEGNKLDTALAAFLAIDLIPSMKLLTKSLPHSIALPITS